MKNKTKPILTKEQYEVKFRVQMPDGYWTTKSLTYYGKSKADHDSVKEQWQSDYPNGELIYIAYM